MHVCARNAGQLVFSFGDFARDFAADRGKLPFEIAQAGFFCVLGDDAQHGVVGDFQAVCCEMPLSSSCRGIRYLRAISSFSSLV